VWKAGTDGAALKVGFGIDGSWSVAWVCGVPEAPTAATVKANVPSTSCTVATTSPTGSYDKCYNDMMLKALNKYRLDHIVDELPGHPANVAELAKQVTANMQTASWSSIKTADQPTGLVKPTGNYLELWYPSTDTAALFATGAAVDGWYAGKAQYSYKKVTPTIDATGPKCIP